MVSINCWILPLCGPSSLTSYIIPYLPLWLPFDLGPWLVTKLIAEDKLHIAVIETVIQGTSNLLELVLTYQQMT